MQSTAEINFKYTNSIDNKIMQQQDYYNFRMIHISMENYPENWLS